MSLALSGRRADYDSLNYWIRLVPTADDHRVARHAAAAIVLTVAEAAIPLPPAWRQTGAPTS